MGLKLGAVALRFGVNDMGSIMIEENVISAAGADHWATDDTLRHVITDAGFTPRQRTTLYEEYVKLARISAAAPDISAITAVRWVGPGI